mgnify:CR=1 FL=1
MLKIFLSSHGSMASGMQSSLKILMGECENLTVFDAYLDESCVQDHLDAFYETVGPEDEVLLCEYYREKGLGEFVFVTHFPTAKRPFYVMDDPHNPRETLSFDLLFRGLEITTGGQRIHDYQEQMDKLAARKMNAELFESFTMLHKYGMPPHGGLGIGLERLTMQLLGLNNIREASMFPRDMNRLEP